MTTRVLLPLLLLGGLQALDILLHALTGGVEPVRLASNIIIGLGAIAAVFAPPQRAVALLFSGGVIYLVLNLAFLVQHGLVNPATDAFRSPLFGFVAGSLLLAAWLARRAGTNRADN